jgi:hypothetical protein
MERRPSYEDLDDDTLHTLLAIRRKNLGILEQQAALYTFINVPSHVLLNIEEQQKAITAIKAVIETREESSSQSISVLTEFIEPAIDQVDLSSRKLGRMEQCARRPHCPVWFTCTCGRRHSRAPHSSTHRAAAPSLAISRHCRATMQAGETSPCLSHHDAVAKMHTR